MGYGYGVNEKRDYLWSVRNDSPVTSSMLVVTDYRPPSLDHGEGCFYRVGHRRQQYLNGWRIELDVGCWIGLPKLTMLSQECALLLYI